MAVVASTPFVRKTCMSSWLRWGCRRVRAMCVLLDLASPRSSHIAMFGLCSSSLKLMYGWVFSCSRPPATCTSADLGALNVPKTCPCSCPLYTSYIVGHMPALLEAFQRGEHWGRRRARRRDAARRVETYFLRAAFLAAAFLWPFLLPFLCALVASAPAPAVTSPP